MTIVIVLDNIRSLNNIGSVFRTADAFLIEKVYLCGITAKPPHKDIHKTALGATESVAWEYCESTLALIQSLEDLDFVTIAVEQAENATMLQHFEAKTNRKYALVFGNEVKGVSQAFMDIAKKCIEIPQFGTKHSLNISVSIGIISWYFIEKMLKVE